MLMDMLMMVMALWLGSAAGQTPAPPKPGVKTPGVKIPIERLQPEAVFPVPGSPDWIVVDEDVWISNKPKDSVARLNPKTNTVAATIPVGKQPGFLAAGEGGVWVQEQGDGTVAVIDPATNTLRGRVKVDETL